MMCRLLISIWISTWHSPEVWLLHVQAAGTAVLAVRPATSASSTCVHVPAVSRSWLRPRARRGISEEEQERGLARVLRGADRRRLVRATRSAARYAALTRMRAEMLSSCSGLLCNNVLYAPKRVVEFIWFCMAWLL